MGFSNTKLMNADLSGDQNPGDLLYFWGIITTHEYVITSHNTDPYEPIGIRWNVSQGFNVAVTTICSPAGFLGDVVSIRTLKKAQQKVMGNFSFFSPSMPAGRR